MMKIFLYSVALIIALLVLTKPMPAHAAETIEINLFLFGGWCSICGGEGGEYACSNNFGNWNNGGLTFMDPVPAGNIVTGVEIDIFGEWGCEGSFAFVDVKLQNTDLGTQVLNGQCLCSNCDPTGIYTWSNGSNCFPGYNYVAINGGSNSIQLNIPVGLVCVEEVIVKLTYQPGQQEICSAHIPSCAGGCENGGVCSVNMQSMTASCNCTDEYYGPNCQCFVPSEQLETDHPPVMDLSKSGFMSKDMLTLTVDHSVKYYDTTIMFKNQLNNSCDFPRPSDGVTWTVAFDPVNCINILQVVIPWTVAWPTCVFDRDDSDPNWLIFTGEMIIQSNENLGQLAPNRPIHDIRTLVWDLPFEIRFPKQISLSTLSMKAYSQIDVVAAITLQDFVSGPPVPGYVNIDLLTSIQYPFILIAPASLTGDTNRFDFSVTGSTICPDNGNICYQTWSMVITPYPGECNFNGNYSFLFTIGCQPSQNDCPIDDDTNTGVINFELQSEDFCAQIVETIDLSATFESFEDSSHTIPKTNFLLGQTAYFRASVSSVKATIIGVTTSDFSTVVGSDTFDLYDGSDTLAGTLVSFEDQDNMESGEATYQELVIAPAVFNVGNDQNEFVAFAISLNVTYLDTQAKKSVREVTVQNSQGYKTQTQITVSNPSKHTVSAAYVFEYSWVMALATIMALFA